jgi:excisionase family DNA binding protein
MNMIDLLTTKQVQDLLRVDRTTIYRMVEGGLLPAIRVGKQWRFARTEVDRWLQAGRSHAVPTVSRLTRDNGVIPPETGGEDSLSSLLPLPCAQLIQDAFADILGLTMIMTDMQGQPVTEMSNSCGFFTFLTARNPQAMKHCVVTWQQMAGAPSLEPRFSVNEMGLLCARALVRKGAELKGSVVIGGIAPENWPPNPGQVDQLAGLFEVSPIEVAQNVEAVYRLDRGAQERALRFVQRIADIFSHMLEDRSQLLSTMQMVSLTFSAGQSSQRQTQSVEGS